MTLNAQQVEALQNATPTDWSKFDQDMVNRSDYNANRFAGDDRLHVRFFVSPMLDQQASDKEGRPIYTDTEMCEVLIPGDKYNGVTVPVWASGYDKRFPKAYEQFKAGAAEQIVGTPLKLAPFLSASQAEELAYFKIRTIEQLASIADANLTFMGARDLRDRAKAFLDKSQSNEALMARIEALEKATLAAEAARAEAEAQLQQAKSAKRS